MLDGLFDTYCMLDWSLGRSPEAPHAAWGTRHGGFELVEVQEEEDPSLLFRGLATRFHEVLEEGRRILFGCSFPFAYPRGLATRLEIGGLPWLAIWREWSRLRGGDREPSSPWSMAAHVNHRASGTSAPFWGCPEEEESEFLSPTRTDPNHAGLPRLRRAEERLYASGAASIQEAWRLQGPGAVGQSALRGIPFLLDLHEDPRLAPVLRVWPFETGFTALPTPKRGPSLILAEVWSGIPTVAWSVQRLRAARQGTSRCELNARALCAWAAAEDHAGGLSARFAAPADLRSAEAVPVQLEEGWILGT